MVKNRKAIAIVLLTYVIVQCIFVSWSAFSTDDFWLAYHNLQYKNTLPYRDFSPYKSVLGYYVLLIPLIVFHGILTPLVFTKIWIILINTIGIGLAFFWLKKFYQEHVVLLSLILILVSPTFLFFSTEIRVDILSWWICL